MDGFASQRKPWLWLLSRQYRVGFRVGRKDREHACPPPGAERQQ